MISCSSNQSDMKLKEEVIQTEESFCIMAAEKGLAEAFSYFADENAVINRGNKIIQGKAEIKRYYSDQSYLNVKLEWKPDFVDVASSGDLAYTYGKYIFSTIDSNSTPISNTGIFHTVWKRQADGKWKFVWD